MLREQRCAVVMHRFTLAGLNRRQHHMFQC